MRIRRDQPHAAQPALHQAAQKRRPEGAILRGTDVDAEDLALALAHHANRDHRRLARDTAVDPHLVIRGIDQMYG